MLSWQTLLVLAACAIPAVAGAAVCDAYTPETPCIALEGVCYNAATCQCETHFQKAECLVDPCSVNKCADGYKCRSSRCGGCHHQCDKIEATPAPAPTPAPRVCNAYTPETPCIALEGVCYNAATCQCETHFQKAECLVDPCSVNKCADGYKCRSSRCGGCHHQCDKVEATPAPAPTPAPRVCNAYTPETPCIALEGVCYNAGTCQCETHFQKAECLVDPCSVNKCADGYKCRSSRCGGCHHQCDKVEATPAPAPTPAPRVCNAYTPETPCIALEGVCYNAATCQCETHFQKAECLVDPCSVNKCADGYKCRSSRCGGCHHQCDKIEATPAPAPTPAPRVCNAYTPETPCIAQEGVCYNSGTCQCGFHPRVQCWINPCWWSPCGSGYECRPTNCGECGHQCSRV